jgi:hypothetical protein
MVLNELTVNCLKSADFPHFFYGVSLRDFEKQGILLTCINKTITESQKKQGNFI